MKWLFIPVHPGQVENEITQRDQFNNDSVSLSESLVRETVQNSLDAAVSSDAQVKVVFRWITQEDGLGSDFMRKLFVGHLEHAKEVLGESLKKAKFDRPKALVIEDFGTKGLTGKVDGKDYENFCDFWRRHGKSHKKGKDRGRWGLGKLVFSSSSKVRAFFGATRRADDERLHIMGQTVLGLHTHEGKEYPPHAFFCSRKELAGEDFPVPLEDPDLVDDFLQNFDLMRTDETGLSVIIPFPSRELEKEEMIGVAIGHYYYPLITGQLVLQFDDVVIDKNNIRDLAHKYAEGKFNDVNALFDFIFSVTEVEDEKLLVLNKSWADDSKLDDQDFEDEDVVEKIRNDFSDGKLIGLKLQVELNKKGSPRQRTSFKAFIQRPADLEKGEDLYVRGGLTLPDESKFGSRLALGAMVAEEEPICAFLGDAENPSHTKWIQNTEKLKNNYSKYSGTVKAVKRSLQNLYDMIATVAEERSEDALIGFFSIQDSKDDKKKPKKKKREVTPIDYDAPPPKPKPYQVSEIDGGFSITSTPDSVLDGRPHRLVIETAYEGKGNAFKSYSKLDFDLAKRGAFDIDLDCSSAELLLKNENRLEFEIDALPFKVQVEGFDRHRDLRVKLETEVLSDEND